MKKTLFFLLVMLIGSFIFAQQNVSAPQKFALVIGNSAYSGISPLRNPVNDANDMETALRGLGFTVEKVLNGNLEQMEIALENLGRRLISNTNSYGFFFYAGHGVQANGENYLIPVDASAIRNESNLRSRAVSLDSVLTTLSNARNTLNMVVLDACRDNPFGWARSGSRGLSVVTGAPSGTIVMFAAGAGQQAADGEGRNGLFTSHLLQNLRTQSFSVFEMFDRTMTTVINATNGNQHPELSLRAGGTASIYLGTRPAVTPTPAPTVQPTPAPAPAAAVQPTPAPAVQPPAANTAVPADFVRIQGGTFTMGSPANEEGRSIDGREGPQRQVTVSSFMMNRYEITQREYQEVMGTNPSRFTRNLNHPVEQVSWFDAVEYCNRRSQREGLTPAYTISGSGGNRTVTWNRNTNGYRLPTEAEWEYACRAGTTTAYYTGANISNNTGWYDANSGNATRPVGQLPANAWGLYDMHGNVSEWCWDLYGNYPAGAQSDPTGASSGSYRAIRSSSWAEFAVNVRSACRFGLAPTSRNSHIGFRVVRN
ncbi:MAG: SUMF1/EgtB/PvdO family nonheme iron enzyme [Treponema sp.]|nr:SUMF1/EgtB/PvdO family nonheme iron enzyme [Treponema sp.]MCL2245340.1 SUMF1/EgtB/PvdO family nonheme iron enzyme [Treponema sp.]